MRIGQKHLDQIFSSNNEMTSGSMHKKRATSAAPALRHGDGKNDIKLTFNAKDKNQLKMIQNALKQEQANDMRPSTRTYADSEGNDHTTAMSYGKDRFKSGLTANTNEQEVVMGIPVNLTNQKYTDNRQTVNAFHQQNAGVLKGELPLHRNHTVMQGKTANLHEAHDPTSTGLLPPETDGHKASVGAEPKVELYQPHQESVVPNMQDNYMKKDSMAN